MVREIDNNDMKLLDISEYMYQVRISSSLAHDAFFAPQAPNINTAGQLITYCLLYLGESADLTS